MITYVTVAVTRTNNNMPGITAFKFAPAPSWPQARPHEQTIDGTAVVKLLPVRPRKRPQREVSAENSMLMSVSHCGPARG